MAVSVEHTLVASIDSNYAVLCDVRLRGACTGEPGEHLVVYTEQPLSGPSSTVIARQVWKSTNHGVDWAQTHGPTVLSIPRLSTGQLVRLPMAGMAYGAILGTSPGTVNGEDDFGARTTDLGGSWSSLMASSPWTGATASLCFDIAVAAEDNILAVGRFTNAGAGYATPRHVMRSTDGGVSFLPIATFVSPSGGSYDILGAPDTIVAVTDQIILARANGLGTRPNSEAEIYRSTDGGTTWTQVLMPMFDVASAGNVTCFAVLPNGRVIAGGNQEPDSPPTTTRTNPCVWVSTDYGETWSAPYFVPDLVYTGGNNVTLNRVIALSGTVLLAGLSNLDDSLVSNGHWVVSTDAGATWTEKGTRVSEYPSGVAFGRFNSIGAADDGSVLSYLERSSTIGPGCGEIWRTTITGAGTLIGPCGTLTEPETSIIVPTAVGRPSTQGGFGFCGPAFTPTPCPQVC